MTTRETLTKLADLLDDKANVCSAEAILAQRSGEDHVPHDKRAKSARFYAAACRTAVQEMEGLERRLAVRTKRGQFVPPTKEECHAYGKEIGLPPVECDGFMDRGEQSGWKLSNGNPMICWKAAMRTSLRNAKQFHPELFKTTSAPPTSSQDPDGWRAYLATREIAYQPFLTMSACIRHDFREKQSTHK